MSHRKELDREYPSNSHKSKQLRLKEKERPKKIIKGKVTKRKKSLGSKFAETFVSEDVGSVTSYIIHDVLIPSAKNAISDMIQGGIELLLFGERKGNRTSRSGGKSHVSYNSIYSSGGNRRQEVSTRNRARHNFDDIALTTRGEAEEVLSHLVDLCIDYGQASVSDLYDLVGITGEFTDNKYGWVDLGSASVSRARDGYLLNLPKVILLD